MNVWELKSYLAHKKSFDYKIFYTDNIELTEVIGNAAFIWETTSGIINSLELSDDISLEGAIKLLWPVAITPEVVKFDIKDKSCIETLETIARTYALDIKQDSSMTYDMLGSIPRSITEDIKENAYINFETLHTLNVTGIEKIDISKSLAYEIIRSIARQISYNIEINIPGEIHLAASDDSFVGDLVECIQDKFCLSTTGATKFAGNIDIEDNEYANFKPANSIALVAKEDNNLTINLPIDLGSSKDLCGTDPLFLSKLAVTLKILNIIVLRFNMSIDIKFSGAMTKYRWARLEDYASEDLSTSDIHEIQSLNYYEI